ncbi:FAD-dependent monooxygenase [Actinoplanes sp. NPDC049802]|uniref:FAD-dependent monooxygenase n=1 Tax=Actinoplanes sp. NPDC049802 TaxID=3154742 RepID=UPI0033C81C09
MARAVVIGAGIGGLAAGLALRRRGWEVTVLERAPSLEPVGAGLAVAPNALRVLDALGAGERIRKLAGLQGAAGIQRPDGGWISRTDASKAAARYGEPVIVVHRAVLVQMLAESLAPGDVWIWGPFRTRIPHARGVWVVGVAGSGWVGPPQLGVWSWGSFRTRIPHAQEARVVGAGWNAARGCVEPGSDPWAEPS